MPFSIDLHTDCLYYKTWHLNNIISMKSYAQQRTNFIPQLQKDKDGQKAGGPKNSQFLSTHILISVSLKIFGAEVQQYFQFLLRQADHRNHLQPNLRPVNIDIQRCDRVCGIEWVHEEGVQHEECGQQKRDLWPDQYACKYWLGECVDFYANAVLLRY